MMTNDIEWKMVKLGDVCQIKDGTHQTPHYVENGKQFYSVENVTNNDFSHTKYISESEHKKLTATYRIEKGDVLMTRIGSIGVCKYIDWDVDASFYVSLALLKCNKTFINPRYFVFYSQTKQFREEILSHSLQFAIPMKINLGKISDVLISIPYKNGSPDLETQKQIAQKLGDMDSLIAAKEKLLAKKRNLKVAAMQKLIKDEESENWKKVRLGDVAEFLPTNTLSRDELNYSVGEYLNIHYGDVLIKFDSVTDVLNSEIPFVALNKKFSDKSLLKNGDIVMADTAEDESVGKVTEIQNIDNYKVVSGLHTLCMRFQENLFAPKFAGYYFNSPAFHNLLLPYMHGTKVTSIAKGDVKKILFSIPYKNGSPDLNAQRCIASILSDMDSEISAIKNEITKLQNLKTAMMQKMFCFEDSDSSSE